MPELNDQELLAQFARRNSEAAFATLVSRYVNLVYSVGLRKTGDAQAAEEITQAVFIILARKAGGLSSKTVLSGWLCETARLTAANYLRTEIRRQKREQEAYVQSLLNDPPADEAWRQIAPLLDDAIGNLNHKDRSAVVLRFFENRSLSEVGHALGASEDAAKMRVNRALEKLRKFFGKRGITFSVTAIAGAVSLNSIQAAPIGLATTVVTTAVKGSTVAASTLTLIKGALKIMAWTKAKTTIVVGVSILLATGTATVITEKIVKAKMHSAANGVIGNQMDTLELKDLPTTDGKTQRAREIACANNMKQIGLGVKLWAIDNGNVFPPDIVSMSNELNAPKILVCPGDVGRQAARDFSTFTDANCSYAFLAAGGNDREPGRVMLFCPLHGNVALCDGSVQTGIARNHPDWLVKRNGHFFYFEH